MKFVLRMSIIIVSYFLAHIEGLDVGDAWFIGALAVFINEEIR